MISIHGAASTEVYPRTRTDALNYFDRPVVRATQVKNCVRFDARLSHKGEAKNTNETNLKLCFAFTVINSEASNKCLKSRAMYLRVADLLAQSAK